MLLDLSPNAYLCPFQFKCGAYMVICIVVGPLLAAPSVHHPCKIKVDKGHSISIDHVDARTSARARAFLAIIILDAMRCANRAESAYRTCIKSIQHKRVHGRWSWSWLGRLAHNAYTRYTPPKNRRSIGVAPPARSSRCTAQIVAGENECANTEQTAVTERTPHVQPYKPQC